jgi:pyridinium-3,5-biscarboxylic acid mononucleotide sulfurtransferase
MKTTSTTRRTTSTRKRKSKNSVADTRQRREGVAGGPKPRRQDDAGHKELRLRELISSLDSLIIAFSGGVDSAYLAWVATQVLGAGALCVTADSPSYPEHHRQLALRLAREFDLRHEIIHTGELERPDYRANPVNRCYYCKHELYSTLSALARAREFDAIADGSNADDRGDYRPGRQAAREFGVRSPLDEVDLTKAEIRELSRAAGLPTWDEPASACLSSRIPYHSEVTDEKLRLIERAEETVRALGFRVCRVRHLDRLARVEIGVEELPRALEPAVTSRIVRELRGLGYVEVTIDPRGYRMGSLNEGLRLRPVQ